MEDTNYYPTMNLADLDNSSDSDSLEDFSCYFKPETVPKPKSNKVTNKSLEELLQEHTNLAETIKGDDISQINVEEKLKQMKIEKHCEDEIEPVQSVEKEFKIFCVKDSLQFFNSFDVTPLLCGYDNRSEELTQLEKDMLTYVRVELESVLSSFLLTCHPCSISDCKSFVNFLLYHISVSKDIACVNACYNRLIALLSEHPHAQNISFSSAEIFMLLFNYGIDVENCELLEQRSGIKRHLVSPKFKSKSANEIPHSWTYNLQVLLDSFISLVSTCDFKPKELCNILLFLFWMSLDSTLLKKKFYIVIQDTISTCMEHITEDKWSATLYELANVLMSLKFSCEREKWSNIYSMIELVSPASEMCIYLRRHISFLALKLLCAESKDSEIDINLCKFSLEEFKALIQSFVDISCETSLCFAANFADLCLNHLNADKEHYIELCNIIKKSESALHENAHVAKSHIIKIYSRLKILLGKVSSWQETSHFGKIKIEVESPEKKNVSIETKPGEFSDNILRKDGKCSDIFPTTSTGEPVASESSGRPVKSLYSTDKSCEAINIEDMELENDDDSGVNKIKIRRLSENTYFVASLVVDENADNPELLVSHADSDMLVIKSENCDENSAVDNPADYRKIIGDVTPQAEFAENNIVVASVTSYADSSVEVEQPVTIKREKLDGKLEGYIKISGHECDMVGNITPQDEFAENNIVVTSVMSCVDSTLDTKEPVVFKIENMKDVEPMCCNNSFVMQEFVSDFVENAEPSNELSSSLNMGVSKDVNRETNFHADSSIDYVIMDNPTLMCGDAGSTFNSPESSDYSTVKNPIIKMISSIEPQSDTPMPVIKEIKSMSNVPMDMEKEISISPILAETCEPDVMELPMKDLFSDNSAQNTSVDALDLPPFDLDSKSNANVSFGNQSKTTSAISPDHHSFMSSPKLEEFIPLTVGETEESIISQSPALDEVLYDPHNENFAGGVLFQKDLLKSVSNLGIAQKLKRPSCSTESFSRTPEPSVNEILTRNTESLLKKIDMDIELNANSKPSQCSVPTDSVGDEDEIVFIKEVESPTKSQKSKYSDKRVSATYTENSSDNDPQIIFVKQVDSSSKNKNSPFSTPFQKDAPKDNDGYAKNSHKKVRKDDIVFVKEKYGKPAKQKPSTNKWSKWNLAENRTVDSVKQWFPKTSSELEILPVGGIQNCKSSSRRSSTEFELDKLLKNSNIEISLSSVSTSCHNAFSKPNLDNDIVILKEIYSPDKQSKKSGIKIKPLDAVKPQLTCTPTKNNLLSKNLAIESVQVEDKSIENTNIEILNDFTPVHVEDECLQVEDECLPVENECLQVEDECFQVEEECLPVENECLQIEDECLEVEDECLKAQDEYIPQQKDEGLILEDNETGIDFQVSEVVYQLIENVHKLLLVSPETENELSLKASFDNAADGKSEIDVLSKIERHSISLEDDNFNIQSETEVINHIVKLKSASPSENLLKLGDIVCTDGTDALLVYAVDPLLNLKGDGGIISEKQSSLEEMSFDNVESDQNSTTDSEVFSLLNSLTRSVASPNQQAMFSCLSFGEFTKPKTNSLNSSTFSNPHVPNADSTDLKDQNASNKNDGKENSKLKKTKDPIVVRVKKHIVAKMCAKSIPLINSNHCVNSCSSTKTCSSSSRNTLNKNNKLDQNKVLNSRETFKSGCVAENNTLSTLSSPYSKLNRKRKNTEFSDSFSKVQKVTNSKTVGNLDTKSSRQLKSNKTSPFKSVKFSPPKSKIFLPTHYHRKKTSPFKPNFKASPKKPLYSRLKSKPLLSEKGLALSAYLRRKVMPSSSVQVPKPIFTISDSDSNSDVEILYCDPKKYIDRDCIILYESEDLVVLD